MGTSTDANLAYGFDLGDNCPWDDDEEEDGFYSWIKKFPEVKDLGATIGTHCSYEYPMYMVMIESTEIIASRGYPRNIAPEDLAIDSSWDEQIKKFCEITGIEYQRPGWLLYSLWG